MNELERRLQELGGEIAYPATPGFDLSFARRPARLPLRPLALGFAILLAVLGGVLALSPGARSAFLEIFHLKGATVELVETLPQVDVQRIDFGERVSLEEAERRVGFQLLDLGEPDAVFVRGTRMVSLVYGPVEKPRLVLSELRGAVWDGMVKKVGSRGTRIENVTIDGERGLFITGDEHFVMFLDENDRITDEPTYLAGTVLLWNRGPLLLRIEGDLIVGEAVALAHAVK